MGKYGMGILVATMLSTTRLVSAVPLVSNLTFLHADNSSSAVSTLNASAWNTTGLQYPNSNASLNSTASSVDEYPFKLPSGLKGYFWGINERQPAVGSLETYLQASHNLQVWLQSQHSAIPSDSFEVSYNGGVTFRYLPFGDLRPGGRPTPTYGELAQVMMQYDWTAEHISRLAGNGVLEMRCALLRDIEGIEVSVGSLSLKRITRALSETGNVSIIDTGVRNGLNETSSASNITDLRTSNGTVNPIDSYPFELSTGMNGLISIYNERQVFMTEDTYDRLSNSMRRYLYPMMGPGTLFRQAPPFQIWGPQFTMLDNKPDRSSGHVVQTYGEIYDIMRYFDEYVLGEGGFGDRIPTLQCDLWRGTVLEIVGNLDMVIDDHDEENSTAVQR